MATPDTIRTIAQPFWDALDPNSAYDKVAIEAVTAAVNIMESSQQACKSSDEYRLLAMDSLWLVHVVLEGYKRNPEQAEYQQLPELVKLLNDIETSMRVAAQSFGTEADLNEKLQKCLQKFDFKSINDVRLRANELVLKWQSSSACNADNNGRETVGAGANTAPSSRASTPRPGDPSGSTVSAVNQDLQVTNNGLNNVNANVGGQNNEPHTEADNGYNHGIIHGTAHIDDTKQEEMIDKLHRAPAQYSSFPGSGGCMKGTREALLQEIWKWVMNCDSEDPRIFWLYGPAGTGKSTVAYSLAEGLRSMDILSASFFFKHTNVECADPNILFSTIAYELASLDPDLKGHVVNNIQKHHNAENKNLRLEVQLDELIVRPFSQLQVKAPVVIVIDALDECSDTEGTSRILELIATRIPLLPVPFKLFITSRPEPYIKATIESRMHSICRSFDISRDLTCTNVDIELYLRNRLSGGWGKLLWIADPWPAEQEMKALVHQSEGLFIYASTAVKFIMDKRFMIPEVQLDILLDMTHNSGLDPVNALYLRVLQCAIPEDADEALRFPIALAAVVLVREALSASTLERLFWLQAGDVRRLLSGLHSVVSVPDSDDEIIYVVHPSFPRFLTVAQPISAADPRFFINSGEYHSLIAKNCLRHMQTLVGPNICEFENFTELKLIPSDKNESGLISARIPDVLKYSCHHFAAHLHAADCQDDILYEMLLDWARCRLLFWLEALALLGSLGNALPSLQLLSDWLKKRDRSLAVTDSKLQSLLKDATRIISESYDTIRRMPLQIYISCVGFSPADSEFRKCYHGFSDIQILHGNRQKWAPLTLLHALNFKGSRTTGMALSSDGRILACLHSDYEIELLDMDTHTCRIIEVDEEDKSKGEGMRTKDGNGEKEDGGDMSKRGMLETAEDVDMEDEDVEEEEGSDTSGEELESDHEEEYEYCALVVFSPDDKYIVGWGHIYDTSTAEEVFRPADCIAFSPNGRLIALSSDDGGVDLYDLRTHEHMSTLSGHTESITSMAFSPDSKQLASASSDHTLRFWNVDGPMPIISLPRRESSKNPHSVVFSPDGSYLAFCDEDQVRIWMMREGVELLPLTPRQPIAPFKSPQFSPDSRGISWLTHHQNLSTSHYLVYTIRLDEVYEGHELDLVCSMAFSPSGGIILAGIEAGKVALLHPGVHNPRPITQTVHCTDRGRVVGIVPSSGGRYFASRTNRNSICIWEVDEGSPSDYSDDWDNVRLAVFAPDGRSIAVVVGDLVTQREVWKLDALTGHRIMMGKMALPPEWIEFSADSRFLAAHCTNPQTLQTHVGLLSWDMGVYDVLIQSIVLGHISAYAFSRDAAYIAICYKHQSLHHLHVISLRQLGNRISFGAVEEIKASSLQFSPDNRHVAALTRDGSSILVWDVSTGGIHCQLPPTQDITEFVFSPDGSYIVVCQYVCGIHLWDFLKGSGEGVILHVHMAGLTFSPINHNYIAGVEDNERPRIVLIDLEGEKRITEADEFSSCWAALREFRRRGRLPHLPVQDLAKTLEDKQRYPSTVDEEGWIQTALKTSLCRLPMIHRPGSKFLTWGNMYDTNGNRIVVISASRLTLLQFGAVPLFESHPPMRARVLESKEEVAWEF